MPSSIQPRLSTRAELDEVLLNIYDALRLASGWGDDGHVRGPSPLTPAARRQLLRRAIRFHVDICQLLGRAVPEPGQGTTKGRR